MSGPQPPPAQLLSSRWRLGLALTVAMCFGNVIQFALGTLGPLLTESLQISHAQLGLLTSTYFVVGMLLSPSMGRAVDRVGGRPMLIGMFVASGLALMAMARAPTYAWVAVAVGGAGIGLAMSNPVTNQLVAVNVPRGEQGLLMGVKQSGVQIGAFIAGFVLPAGAVYIGWRGVVLATGVVTLLAPVIVMRAVPGSGHPISGAAHDSGPARVPPLVWWITGYAVLMGAGLAALITYLPLYAHEVLGLSVPAAGATAGMMGTVGIGARILWARWAERHRSIPLALVAIAVGSLGSLALLIGAEMGTPALVWLAAVGFGGTTGAWNAVGMLAVVREVDTRVSGRASGRVLSGFYVGLVVSPALFGRSVDLLGAYRPGWIVMGFVFLAAVAVSLGWRRTTLTPTAPSAQDSPRWLRR
jgi:predicted MFS family arabinose efflux permease